MHLYFILRAPLNLVLLKRALDVQAYLAAQKQAAVAGTSEAFPRGGVDHEEAIREYYDFLVAVPHWGQLTVSWEQVER